MPLTILQRIAAGDAAAVQECLDRYGNLVWSLARRFLANRSDAEEAVQDVFVDLWNHAQRFDPSKAEETTFVAMIARRRLIDRLRQEKRRPVVEQMETVPDLSGPSELDRIEARDEASQVMRVLSTFKEDQRRVLQRAIVHGQTHRDIAEEFGIPLGTVKTHVRRGLIRIREAMRESRPGSRPEVSG